MSDVEDVVEKVIALLGAEMPAALAAIETEKSDGMTLEPVAKFYFGERFLDLVAATDKPVVTVSPESSEARNIQGGYSEDDETIVVTVILRGDKEEILTRKALRYARAVRNVLAEHPVMDLFESGDVKRSEVAGVSYAPISRAGAMIFIGVDVRLKVGMVNQTKA